MEKKALVLLSLGALLGLASCGGVTADSSSTPSESSSDISGTDSSSVSEGSVPGSSSTSSSIDSGDSTSSPSDSTTSEEGIELGTWDAEMETALAYITGDHIPPVTADLAAADPVLGQDSNGDYAILAYEIDYSVAADWASVLIDAGYVDNTDLYGAMGYEIMEGEVVLDIEFDDGAAIQIDIYFVDDNDNFVSEGIGSMAAYVFYTEPPITEFPATDIADYLEYYYGITGVEVPAFEADEYVIFEPSSDYPFIEVDGYTDADPSEDYAIALADAGWTATELSGIPGYTDPTAAAFLAMGYDTEYSVFYIILMPAPSTEWPTDSVNEILAALDATGVELPVLEGAEYYEVNTDYLGFLGIAYVLCGGIDGVDTYYAALEAAGWTYDADNDIYIDPTDAVAVYAEYYEGQGTQIIIQAAPAPILDEFPADDLAAALAEYGYTGIDIPAPEGEFTGYAIDDTFAEYGSLYLCCYTTTDCTESYEAQLLAEGWTYDSEEYGYVSPDNADIVISVVYYEDSGYFEIAIYWPLAY